MAHPIGYTQNNCDFSAPECSNCVSLVKQLDSALEEIESAKFIINLLQKESTENSGKDNRFSDATNSSSNTSASVYPNRLEHNKRSASTIKGFSSKNFTETSNFYAIPTANR